MKHLQPFILSLLLITFSMNLNATIGRSVAIDMLPLNSVAVNIGSNELMVMGKQIPYQCSSNWWEESTFRTELLIWIEDRKNVQQYFYLGDPFVVLIVLEPNVEWQTVFDVIKIVESTGINFAQTNFKNKEWNSNFVPDFYLEPI